jgi:purine-binding chemotaxis protein CheW
MNFDHLSQIERALLQKRAQQLSQTEQISTNKTLEVVTLTIADRRFAFQLHDLCSVLHSSITRLPGLPPVVAGAINVQGELVSVLELPLLLGLDLSEPLTDCVLLIASPHGNVGLRVPKLPELETIDEMNTTTVLEVDVLENPKIVLLNIENLLQRAEQALLA